MLTIGSIAAHPLRFTSGDPVRAASAVTRLANHWLIAQDDATHAAVWSEGSAAEALRVFPAVGGADTFSEAEDTKKLKPDLEAACTVATAEGDAALLLGSGSLQQRMRAALVSCGEAGWKVATADLAPLYERVAAVLDLPPPALNLEGACVVGSHLRWFQRGHAAGVASAAVDVDLASLIAAVRGTTSTDAVALGAATAYDLGQIDGVPLAITDAAALPDGRIIVSAAAEDAPDAVADGPIVASALGLIAGERVIDVVSLPQASDGEVWKVEGLAVRGTSGGRVELLAVVDQDDPQRASLALSLDVQLP